jgi:hypothetical protein
VLCHHAAAARCVDAVSCGGNGHLHSIQGCAACEGRHRVRAALVMHVPAPAALGPRCGCSLSHFAATAHFRSDSGPTAARGNPRWQAAASNAGQIYSHETPAHYLPLRGSCHRPATNNDSHNRLHMAGWSILKPPHQSARASKERWFCPFLRYACLCDHCPLKQSLRLNVHVPGQRLDPLFEAHHVSVCKKFGAPRETATSQVFDPLRTHAPYLAAAGVFDI